jgi:hypothetical protein
MSFGRGPAYCLKLTILDREREVDYSRWPVQPAKSEERAWRRNRKWMSATLQTSAVVLAAIFRYGNAFMLYGGGIWRAPGVLSSTGRTRQLLCPHRGNVPFPTRTYEAGPPMSVPWPTKGIHDRLECGISVGAGGLGEKSVSQDPTGVFRLARSIMAVEHLVVEHWISNSGRKTTEEKRSELPLLSRWLLLSRKRQ